jgi:prepilin-type N-terminal cleavage/methylation domain-containing protein
MRPSARQPRGFTLLELVIVMLVVTTILALAAPQMRGFLAGTRSRDATTQLVALTGYAKARAAAEAKVYRLNLGADSYSLSVEEGQGFRPVATDFGKEFSIPDTLHVEIVPLPSGMIGPQAQRDPADDGRGILFYPDGRPVSTMLKLTDDKGRVTIIASPSPAEAFRVITEAEAKNL